MAIMSENFANKLILKYIILDHNMKQVIEKIQGISNIGQ